jgi:hypothetical protein
MADLHVQRQHPVQVQLQSQGMSVVASKPGITLCASPSDWFLFVLCTNSVFLFTAATVKRRKDWAVFYAVAT